MEDNEEKLREEFSTDVDELGQEIDRLKTK